ncbi:hypothetical protein COOONC_04020 [Cooperia oncophora]
MHLPGPSIFPNSAKTGGQQMYNILRNCNINVQSVWIQASLAYAVDLSAPVSVAGFQCMRNNLYNVAFIRAYTPTGQGQIDPYACANIQNANAAGMGTEVYMTPQPNSAKTGAQQVR